MKIKCSALVLLVCVLISAVGCSATKRSTPDATIAAAYRLCGEGHFEEAASNFTDGARAWAFAPDYVQQVCDQVTDKRSVQAWVFVERSVNGDVATFTTRNYLDAARTKPGATLHWKAYHSGDRWLIGGVTP